jgi:hypothetical protein
LESHDKKTTELFGDLTQYEGEIKGTHCIADFKRFYLKGFMVTSCEKKKKGLELVPDNRFLAGYKVALEESILNTYGKTAAYFDVRTAFVMFDCLYQRGLADAEKAPKRNVAITQDDPKRNVAVPQDEPKRKIKPKLLKRNVVVPQVPRVEERVGFRVCKVSRADSHEGPNAVKNLLKIVGKTLARFACWQSSVK